MLNQGKLTAGALAAASVLFSTGVMAVDAKGSVYGDLRYSLDFSESNAAAGSGIESPDTDFRSTNSVFGVKASVTESGITAFGIYETVLADDGSFGFTLDRETSREAYAGVTSMIGTLAYGQMYTAYAKAGQKLDPFRNTSLGNIAGTTADGLLGGLLPGVIGIPLIGNLGLRNSFGTSFLSSEILTGGLQENQLAYTTPSFAGVTVNAMVLFDEADNGTATGTSGGENHDYGFGVGFDHSGISAGAQFQQINDDTGVPQSFEAVLAGGPREAFATRVHGGFNHSMFGVGASVELIDEKFFGDQQYYLLSGWVGVMHGTRIAASFGMVNETLFGDGTSVSLGVFHDVIQNLTVYAGATQADLQPNTNAGTVADSSIFALGATYKFDLGVMGGK